MGVSALCSLVKSPITENFNGSYTFGTMKICSRQRLFELMSVYHSTRPGGIIGILFSFLFFNMKVYCVFSLESPHRGDSNEYTQHTVINIKNKIKLSKIY